jgi:hypothetical protein
MKGSAVPGGSMHFNSEPSWLTEKGDMTDPVDSKKAGKISVEQGLQMGFPGG